MVNFSAIIDSDENRRKLYIKKLEVIHPVFY